MRWPGEQRKTSIQFADNSVPYVAPCLLYSRKRTCAAELLRPWDQRSLQMYPVSRRANSSKAAGDDPTLIERIEE